MNYSEARPRELQGLIKLMAESSMEPRYPRPDALIPASGHQTYLPRAMNPGGPAVRNDMLEGQTHPFHHPQTSPSSQALQHVPQQESKVKSLCSLSLCVFLSSVTWRDWATSLEYMFQDHTLLFASESPVQLHSSFFTKIYKYQWASEWVTQSFK